jgi:hypothetical protein
MGFAKNQLLYPFAKFQYYDGGKKFEKMLEVIRLEIMNWVRMAANKSF